uniref:Soluble interferon alpha/beta receptor OPG204 n=1 Tax=Dugesia japonica TaxID=6161 RepID=A0A0B6VQJ8_DUGJA|nr:hypothetical protein [Dugesia japonica]
MLFDMKTLGFLILLTVGSKASINKLFFIGSNVEILCPLDAPFYQWKKYYNDKVTNIFQDDKKKLNVSLKLEESPTTYECGATSGFDNRNFNITIYVLDQNSKKAQELCYNEPFGQKSAGKYRVKYPCFLNDQKETTFRIAKGSSVRLDCEASGTNVSYQWFSVNTINNHKQFLMKYNNSYVAEVDNVNDKSIGQYLCQVNTNSGKKLERNFEISLLEEPVRGNSLISIETPEIINISTKLNRNQKLNCRTNTLITETIRAIKWGKKLDSDSANLDKNQIIPWEGNSYKLLPENQISSRIDPDSKTVSTYLFKDVTSDTTGEYICVVITDSGQIKYKTFYVSVINNSGEEEAPRSFFFLYILIPSLVIAICLFIGIYLTINRRPARKPLNFQNCPKPDTDTSRLRTTPDYSSVQYQANPPPNHQYPPNQNFYNPYYPSSDKLIV